MTWENELGELVGCLARESELQSNNLINIGLSNLKDPAPDTTPAKNPTSNPTKKAPLLFVELRKLRKPGKGI